MSHEEHAVVYHYHVNDHGSWMRCFAFDAPDDLKDRIRHTASHVAEAQIPAANPKQAIDAAWFAQWTQPVAELQDGRFAGGSRIGSFPTAHTVLSWISASGWSLHGVATGGGSDPHKYPTDIYQIPALDRKQAIDAAWFANWNQPVAELHDGRFADGSRIKFPTVHTVLDWITASGWGLHSVATGGVVAGEAAREHWRDVYVFRRQIDSPTPMPAVE